MVKSMKGGDQALIFGIIWLLIILGAFGLSIYLWVRNEKRQQRIDKALK